VNSHVTVEIWAPESALTLSISPPGLAARDVLTDGNAEMKVLMHRWFAGVGGGGWIAMVAVLVAGVAVWAYPAASADALGRAGSGGSAAAVAADFLSVDQNAVATF